MEQDLSERSERCFLNTVQEDGSKKNVNKKIGFGCMRLPMQGGNIDFEECNRMVDAFMEAGFTYFDTAKGYLGGLSEIAVRECVVKRYPRESFTITDKLTMNFFNEESDIRKVFEEQLEACGVSYFDARVIIRPSQRNPVKSRVEPDLVLLF